MASWYDGLVGAKGHKFHQKYAIPTVMNMLAVKRHDIVLDIGCGQGALAPAVAKIGAKYVGVDSSPQMIQAAIQRHRKEGRFYVGDAGELNRVDGLHDKNFSKAVFLLSIQDMKELEKVVEQAANKLKPGGTLVLFMLHPAFRIPRQSGWGEDKKRKIVYRRVDRYLSENAIPLDTKIGIKSHFYHRPLQRYFAELFKNGFEIKDFREIAEEKRGYDEFPTFLAIRAVKTS